jgi:hypothetical protein
MGSPDALSYIMGRGLIISNYTTLTFAQWVTRQNQPSATHSHWFASTVNTALFDMGHMHLLEPSFQRVALGCSFCLLSKWAFSTFVSGTTQKSSGFENCPLWLQKTWKGRNSQGESTEQVDRNCDFEAKTELYHVKQEVLCNAQNKSNWQFKKSPQIFDAIWHEEVLLVQPLHVITRICLSMYPHVLSLQDYMQRTSPGVTRSHSGSSC